MALVRLKALSRTADGHRTANVPLEQSSSRLPDECGYRSRKKDGADHARLRFLEKSPLLPPDFCSSCTLRMTIALSSALVMS